MDYETEQTHSIVYGQQSAVNDQAKLYIHSIYRAGAPLKGRTFSDLQPAELDRMIADTQEAIAELNLLRDLCHSLDTIYARTSPRP